MLNSHKNRLLCRTPCLQHRRETVGKQSSRLKQPLFGRARSKMPGSRPRVLFQGDYELLSSQVRNV